MVASVKVFKKTSPNGKLTVYLGKRDFVDHLDHVDPIEGVVVADADYLKGRKVFCQVHFYSRVILYCHLIILSYIIFFHVVGPRDFEVR